MGLNWIGIQVKAKNDFKLIYADIINSQVVIFVLWWWYLTQQFLISRETERESNDKDETIFGIISH